MNNINRLVCCIGVMVSLLLSQVVYAQVEYPVENIKSCTKIKQDKGRLACFDQWVNKKNTSNIKSKEGTLTAQQIDDFSKEQVKKTTEELAQEVTSITSTIRTLTKTIRGRWVITFENNQQWQQKDSATLRLKQGDKVILSKGALGSVYLKKEHANKRIKVKRLK